MPDRKCNWCEVLGEFRRCGIFTTAVNSSADVEDAANKGARRGVFARSHSSAACTKHNLWSLKILFIGKKRVTVV